MTTVLVLGGTGWVSGRIAERWRDAGAEVTCLARGGREAPHGTSLVRGDRDDPDVFAALRRQDWGEVVDVSSRADHVRAAVTALGPSAARWTYISSVSVYRDENVVGADENAARVAPATSTDGDYPSQKVAAEDAVTAALAERAAIVRPALVVGRGDTSDRFGYWATAFLRAGDGPVLVPPTEGLTSQIVDVDDVAAFALTAPVGRAVNVATEPTPVADLLARMRAATGHTGEIVTAVEEELRSRQVEYWMGPRSLPLWLPTDMPGFTTRSTAAFRAAGGTTRPLDDVIADVIADEKARGIDRERRSGLTRAEELELIDALR